MTKKWLQIAVFTLIGLGTAGSSWAQARCLITMAETKSCYCCPKDQQDGCCPTQKKIPDCPMLTENTVLSMVLVPERVTPSFKMVSFGNLTEIVLVPVQTFDVVDATPQVFRLTRLRETIPLFHAPPAPPHLA